MAQMSQRLINQLSTSCKRMDSGTIESLGASVRSGQLPWFVGEFRAALDGAITVVLWRQITQLDIADGDRPLVEKHVRTVWTAVVPNEPFPGMHWS
jgi:hypothetical protein